jgi:lysophospholipase L1-like esterase
MNASIKLLLLLVALGFSLSRAGAESPRPSASPASVRVACVGDSITVGVGAEPGKSYPSQLQALLGDGWKVKNFGSSGRTLLRKGDHPYWKETVFRDAQEFRPDVVVIMLGTNDTKPQNWQFHGQFHDDYRDLVKTFRSLPSKPRIYVCRPCPVPEPGNFGINEANVQREIAIIDQLAREESLEVIDIHAALEPHPELLPDRVHPNTAGAAIMAQTVAKAIAGK